MSLASIVGSAVSIAFMFIVLGACTSFVQPLCELALNLSLKPLSVPIVNQVILWSQLCALILVIFIRVGKGLYENVFQKAANEETGSAIQWLFKSVIAVSCVAIMPLLCNILIEFGSKAFSDLSSGVHSVVGEDGFNLGFEFPADELWEGLASQPFTALAMYIGCMFFVIGEGVFITMNVYQIVKRQLVCLVVSIAATWVSIKSATDNTDDVIDILVSLLGLVLIQLLQWLFLMLALQQLSNVEGGASLINANLQDQQTLYTVVFSLALMGCALAVPNILERYAFSSGRSGAGNMIVGAAIRTGVASPRKIGASVSSVLTKRR